MHYEGLYAVQNYFLCNSRNNNMLGINMIKKYSNLHRRLFYPTIISEENTAKLSNAKLETLINSKIISIDKEDV